MEIYLIRHTPVDLNSDICYGSTDVKLQPGYAILFSEIRKSLTNIDFKYYYSSPLQRCTILANYLSGDNIIEDPRLKELDFGEWELNNWGDIEQQDYFQQWKYNFYSEKTPGGECFKDLRQRCLSFYNELLNQEHCKVAIIAHSGVIRTILAHELGLTPENAFSLKLSFGGISKIYVHKSITTVDFINRL